jgi:glucose-1-phosphate cytidylyltransferase
MKVVILAGGFGTRISEMSHLIPKPMIRIGDFPILWHIMKHYSYYGHNEFIICGGYKQDVIKQFFNNYFINTSDVTFDFSSNNKITHHKNQSEPWKVTVVDTGLNTMTGGRIKRIKDFLNGDDFLLTYGDGVSNVNINELIKFHNEKKSLVTLTAIQQYGRFGTLDISQNLDVSNFREKNIDDGGWINGGFMVLKNEVLNYIDNDDTVFEKEPLEKLSKKRKLAAFKHNGYWQCMDTLRDKMKLEAEIKKGNAEWITWK